MNLQPMKAITLWQPWASLLACGAKQYETCSWATNYRGPIVIHTAKVKPSIDSIWNQLNPKTTDAAMAALKLDLNYDSIWQIFDTLPRGCIIATAELVGCHKMVLHGGRGISSTDPGWLETENGIYYPTGQELIFGGWMPGRYAWEFANMTLLPEPIPVKGKQGLWHWEGEDLCLNC